MRIIRDPKRLNPCVLVLGMFDGVHRGHQALLMRGDELAQRWCIRWRSAHSSRTRCMCLRRRKNR